MDDKPVSKEQNKSQLQKLAEIKYQSHKQPPGPSFEIDMIGDGRPGMFDPNDPNFGA